MPQLTCRFENEDDEVLILQTEQDPADETAMTIMVGEEEWELSWTEVDELHSFIQIARHHRAPKCPVHDEDDE